MALLVRSTEHDGTPIIGVFIRDEEASVVYVDSDGVEGLAPSDCVALVPDADVDDAEAARWASFTKALTPQDDS